MAFTLHRSNAVRRSKATAHPGAVSTKPQTQANIEYATASEQRANNKRRRRKSPVRNFSLPTNHPDQPRTMNRYYASALTPIDKATLARGDENHNIRSWTLKDVVSFEEARKELLPTNLYIGPDKRVCIIPVIIVTKS
jgi:hypothetical protein